LLEELDLAAFISTKEVPKGSQWDDPLNLMVLSSGPLGGTRFPGSGTICIVTKGPMTNLAGASQLNGFFGAYLRLCGFDAMVVKGKANHLVHLYFDENNAELRDASDLKGKDVFETEDLLRKKLRAKRRGVSVCAIGPAGENLDKKRYGWPGIELGKCKGCKRNAK
jgi:aldehyde:ferredoxin oxidoreductase